MVGSKAEFVRRDIHKRQRLDMDELAPEAACWAIRATRHREAVHCRIKYLVLAAGPIISMRLGRRLCNARNERCLASEMRLDHQHWLLNEPRCRCTK